MCSMLHAPSPLIVRHRVSEWVTGWVSEWVSGCVSGWELLPGVFALNHRILMPHHARSGSVKRATKPESATRIRNRERGGGGGRDGIGGMGTETETETNQKVSHLSASDSVYPFAVWVPPPSARVYSELYINVKYTYNTIKLLFTRFWKEKVQGVYGAHETWFHFNLSSSEFVALFVPA